MDKKKARAFLEELWQLEGKYGLSVSATYEEDFDYDYEGQIYTSGGQVLLTLVDKEGHEVAIDDIDGDAEFCHLDCEEKYKRNKEN